MDKDAEPPNRARWWGLATLVLGVALWTVTNSFTAFIWLVNYDSQRFLPITIFGFVAHIFLLVVALRVRSHPFGRVGAWVNAIGIVMPLIPTVIVALVAYGLQQNH